MLSSEFLISPILSLDALLIAGSNKAFNVYLHNSQGTISVGSGSIPQYISSLEASSEYLSHIRSQLSSLSVKLDLFFYEVSDPETSDISVFFDSEINLDDSGAINFGVTVPNIIYSPRRQWIEIFLNYQLLELTSFDFQAYVFNHELLHALGLEHTFDDSDGDFYLSTDPLLSATPEETVMSYRPPKSGVYPTDLTSSDYLALEQIWGSSKSSLPSQHTVYRLYNETTDQHLFSANVREVDILTGLSHSPFINEGIAYEVTSGATNDLYRFYNVLNGRHFYTSNTFEKDLLVHSDSTPFLYEGSAYRVFASNLINSHLLPVYRFYDPTSHTHLYTANQIEKSIWESDAFGWINEGVAWYA